MPGIISEMTAQRQVMSVICLTMTTRRSPVLGNAGEAYYPALRRWVGSVKWFTFATRRSLMPGYQRNIIYPHYPA